VRAELRVLAKDEVEAIDAATVHLLERVGVNVREPRAMRLLVDAGAERDGGTDRVRIPEALLREAIRGTPKEWMWHARESGNSFKVGGGARTRLGPGSACTKIFDFSSGLPRAPTQRDGDELVRLLDALEFADIAYTPVSYGASSETPRHRETATLVRDLQNTSKVLVGPTYDGAMARDSLKIATLLAGGEDELRKRPMVAGYCDPISPLTHDRMMTEALIEYATMGQPVFVMCLALAGASAPASLAGVLVQQNAEILSGVLIAFLVNRRAPIIYGCVSGTMDMRAGNAAVGGPEFGLLSAASVQLAHSYGLACSTGGQSDAKAHDAQAAFEKGTSLLASMLAGADFVDLFFGSFEGFNVTSPEQVMIDHEIAGYAHRYARGIEVDTAHLSLDLIEAVGPGGSFLKHPSALRDTMSRMKAEWYLPVLFDRGTGDGKETAPPDRLVDRAHAASVRILRDHETTPLDGEVLKDMLVVLDRIRTEESRGSGHN
jgi:trimethylamine--corrinoid protein Co-methyltransferase